MSQNRPSSDFGGTSQTGNSSSTGTPGTPGAGSTGRTGAGTSDPSRPGSNYGSSSGVSTGGASTGAATGLAQTAQEYGGKITEAATQAKDYVTDKVSVVGEKLKDLQNADFGEMADNAKQYARQNPGQAILISAAAGLLLGLIIRGRR